MEDRLPDIAIAIDVEPQVFLDRMTNVIANAATGYTSTELDYSDVGLIGIGLEPVNGSGVTAQLLIDPQAPAAVRVEVQDDWEPEPPSYEQYVAAVRQLFDPLLQAYTQAYTTPLQLSIQSKADTESTVPPAVQQRFDQFVSLANKRVLHPLDWRRWYLFILDCHRNEVMLEATDVAWLLFNAGFGEDQARDIARVYEHGRAILALES